MLRTRCANAANCAGKMGSSFADQDYSAFKTSKMDNAVDGDTPLFLAAECNDPLNRAKSLELCTGLAHFRWWWDSFGHI